MDLLIFYIHCASVYCFKMLFLRATWQIQESTSGGGLRIFGSHTIVPLRWSCVTLLIMYWNQNTGQPDATRHEETTQVKEQQCEATNRGSRFCSPELFIFEDNDKMTFFLKKKKKGQSSTMRQFSRPGSSNPGEVRARHRHIDGIFTRVVVGGLSWHMCSI